MDNGSGSDSQNAPPQISKEFEHITEEIYKKNAQLAYTNKTLSILRKIDDIILSSVTDPAQVAQQVANAVVLEAEYKIVTILLVDKKNGVLAPLAVSESAQVIELEGKLGKKIKDISIVLTNVNNPLVISVLRRTKQQTSSLDSIYQLNLTIQELKVAHDTLSLHSVYTFPLAVRDQVIGALLIGRVEEPEKLTPYDLDLMDRLNGVIGIALDNSLLYQSIQDANKRLQQLDHLKDEFVSLASHELRTPMTVIKSYLWLLLQAKVGPITDKQKEYMERAYFSTERLINLVNDMLNVSRIESGRLTLVKKEVQLQDIVQKLVSEMQARAQEQEIALSFEKKIEATPTVYADPERVEQVLINLIGNSIKFTSKGGFIKVVLSMKDGMVVTSVADNGGGIKTENIPKLFQKFNLVGNEYLRKKNSQGTGLGLYISRAIIELLGGRIWVESEGEGKGAMFSFTLPIFNPAVHKVDNPDQPPEQAAENATQAEVAPKT